MRKNNGLVFLEKLIEDTKAGVIKWTWLNNKGFQYWNEFKGIKNITSGKHIDFHLKFYSYDRSDGEVRVFLVNDILKTRDLIYELSPGFFSFRQKSLLDKLIDTVVDPIPDFKPKENFWGTPANKQKPSTTTTTNTTTKKEDNKNNLDLDDKGQIKPLKRVWDDDDDDNDEFKGVPV